MSDRKANTITITHKGRSIYETEIKALLTFYNIESVSSHRFYDTLNENGHAMEFDIYIPKYNAVIEIDDKSHFRAYKGNKIAFDNKKLRDNLRNVYILNKPQIHFLRLTTYRSQRKNYPTVIKEFVDDITTPGLNRCYRFVGREYTTKLRLPNMNRRPTKLLKPKLTLNIIRK